MHGHTNAFRWHSLVWLIRSKIIYDIKSIKLMNWINDWYDFVDMQMTRTESYSVINL